MREKVKVKYHNPKLSKLERTAKGDCIDLRLNDVSVLRSNEHNNTMIRRDSDDNFICCRYQKGDVLMLDFGVSMELPKGFKANIYPRSSTFKNTGWLLTNSVGQIDNMYRYNQDIWKAMVYCLRDGFVAFDERYFQFEIVPVMDFYNEDFIEVDELEDGERGGYGTSGVQ